MRVLTAVALEADSFAPFGDVLAYDAASARLVNNGSAHRADLAAQLDHDERPGFPVLAIFRARKQSLPLHVTTMEQHPHSSQLFLPLAACSFAVVVAPASNDRPDMAQARAFISAAGQGINYHRGVWHAPIITVSANVDFLMMMWERGTGHDCITTAISPALAVNGSNPQNGI